MRRILRAAQEPGARQVIHPRQQTFRCVVARSCRLLVPVPRSRRHDLHRTRTHFSVQGIDRGTAAMDASAASTSTLKQEGYGMKTGKHVSATTLAMATTALVLSLGGSAAAAQGLGNLGGKLGGVLGGNGDSFSSGSTGNVAGLLQYCVKNNYLGGSSGASGIAGKLLGKTQGGSGNSDYQSGLNGVLKGSNGHTTDLSSVGGGNSGLKSKITTKACGVVLKQGQHFLGH
jgi:hypothetical protein